MVGMKKPRFFLTSDRHGMAGMAEQKGYGSFHSDPDGTMIWIRALHSERGHTDHLQCEAPVR